MNIMTFDIGDAVFWESQANGSYKRKEGTIVAVIPAGIAPVLTSHASLLPPGAGSLPRKEQSYIVSVPGKTDKAKPKHYWPRTSALNLTETQLER
ncbi:hypothetical protein [Dickeya sp. NCPPB 3274]|uniref:hypothetical protein n=1 Tax=Dickeya sp. NCPPB 3274 TaxID=568766 RepID=UPI001EE678D8|nr:hypothetical protein [Dickeya sp. NCPPB 3274]